ncbi:hypothetical protein GCK72_022432 [Caenorhabditis remanei]|uniref:Uncharacterized protein n=1 Tax=Caenorhabditis remanei TaxID=31234 RepID=A0A6A5FTT3_CAERE|nr:hypothetical protein GCK72_022432 [Caenorhabditis remanei]KAF1745982.1 hypothetical protein GCK72_022432 [Caenorhabditis remanei]
MGEAIGMKLHEFPTFHFRKRSFNFHATLVYTVKTQTIDVAPVEKDRQPNSITLFPLYQTPRQALINHNQRELHQLLAVHPPEEVESSEGQDENLFVFVCQPPDNRPLYAMFPNGRAVNEDSSAIASAINDLVQAIQCAEQGNLANLFNPLTTNLIPKKSGNDDDECKNSILVLEKTNSSCIGQENMW